MNAVINKDLTLNTADTQFALSMMTPLRHVKVKKREKTKHKLLGRSGLRGGLSRSLKAPN
jgi:hypothetical protein